MLNLNQAPVDWGLDIQWDWRDMIRGFDCIGGGLARYQYGIDKQRTRKHITRISGAVEDRLYLGGYELYRRRNSQGNVVEEIESLHLFEGEQRVLLVDDVITAKSTAQPGPNGLRIKEQTLFRYQYSNHLGSACLELDHEAAIISYEEYHPYGTSAYRAMTRDSEAPAKRYRYTGMERDEESGLSYHSARYYLQWLGRWGSSDPFGLVDGCNIFCYATNSPVTASDPRGKQTKDEVQIDSQEDIVYTTDPLMAQAINHLTDNTLQQAWDPNTGSNLPAGAPGGMFVSRYDAELSPHVPNLIIAGGYDVTKAFRNYFISPEQTSVDARGNTFVRPAAIVDLGISYGSPDVMAVIRMGLDASLVGSAALKGAALMVSATAKSAPSAAAGIAGLHARIAEDAMSLSFRNVNEQVSFLVSNVPGAESNQVRLLLEKAFEKESSVVLGGSRIRGTSHLASDLDVGFSNLTPNQAAKLTGKVSKAGPLQLETTRIVPGNETANIPKIISPEEFFQRVGIRAAADAKAGQVFLPSGSLTVTPGKMTFIPAGIRP